MGLTRDQMRKISCLGNLIETIGFLLVGAVATPHLAFGQSVALSIGTGSTLPGSTVSIPVSLTSLSGAQETGVQWQLDYPAAAISNISVSAGSAALNAGKTVTCAPLPGRLTCVLFGLNQNTLADGVVANLAVTASPTAAPGPIALTPSGLVTTDAGGRSIAGSATAGTLVISAPAIQPTLTGLTCSPSTVTAPASVSCTLTLSPAAGAGGLAVQLSSNNGNVTVPLSVTVPSGGSSAGFTAAVASIAANQTATVGASVNGSSAAAVLNLLAPRFTLSGNLGTTGSGSIVSLTGAASASVVADAAGNYSFTNLANGSYVVSPSKAGTLFTPANRAVTISGSNLTGINFSAAAQTWNVSGSLGAAGVGALVSLTGAATGSVFADGAGNFTLSGLANGTYTVTPTKSGVAFTPASLSVSVNGANVGGVSFTSQNLTYSISGFLGATGNGATVTLTGSATATTTANNTGGYVFTGLTNGTYTVTPTKTAGGTFTFSPIAQTVVINGADRGNINFQVASGSTWSLSGSVGVAGSGAAINLSGTASAWVTADAQGNYSFSNLANGAYTVTPSKSATTFSPVSQSVSINGANVTGINFSSQGQTWSISGALGAAGSNAVVAVAGPTNTTVTADGAGNYSVSGLADGSYWLTPSKAGTTFTPGSRNVTINGASQSGVNFTSQAQTWSISGSLGSAGSGATVNVSGAANLSVTADGAGSYSINGLVNGTYNLTPVKAGVTFTPSSRTITVNGASVSGTDFTSQGQTWSISGTVGATGSGATVTLTGGSNATVAADGAGNYQFTGLTNGSYTVTPFKSGVSFTPGNRSVTVSGANVTAIDFSGQAQTFTVSGSLGSAGSGAMVMWTGATSGTVTADGAGGYSISGLANGSYTVTPSKAGVTFTPISRSVGINGANVGGVDFVGQSQTWSISGSLGTVGGGASVSLSGTSTAVVIADGNGFYTFSGLSNGSYTVTPSKSNVTFTPLSRTVTLSGSSQTGVNFTSQDVPSYSVSGTAGTLGGSSVVTLSGAANRTVQADAAGNYSFTGLANGTYTVTLAKPGFTFVPPSQTVTISGVSLTGVNFVAQANLYTISGSLGAGANGATVTITGAANRVVLASNAATYVVPGLAPGTYTITPSKVGSVVYAFQPSSQTITIVASDRTDVNFTALPQLPSSRSREGTGVSLGNLASGYLGDACSPGTLASLMGSGFVADDGKQGTTGRVWVNGQDATVVGWTASRIDFQCPQLPVGTELEIVAQSKDGRMVTDQPVRSVMANASPGLFAVGATTRALAQLSATGELIGNSEKGQALVEARRGDYLTIFATGLGAGREALPTGVPAPDDRLIELRNQVRLVLGGMVIEPSFAGLAPGTVGMYQINFQIPEFAPLGSDVPLHLEVRGPGEGGAVSNTVRLPIAKSDN